MIEKETSRGYKSARCPNCGWFGTSGKKALAKEKYGQEGKAEKKSADSGRDRAARKLPTRAKSRRRTDEQPRQPVRHRESKPLKPYEPAPEGKRKSFFDRLLDFS